MPFSLMLGRSSMAFKAGMVTTARSTFPGTSPIFWYTALPALKATEAATVQLSVPVLAAVGGIAFLGESLTPRLVLASAAILGGIALVLLEKGDEQCTVSE